MAKINKLKYFCKYCPLKFRLKIAWKDHEKKCQELIFESFRNIKIQEETRLDTELNEERYIAY